MKTRKRSTSLISIVVPVYNEDKNIRELYRQIAEVVKGLKENVELLFIDDGSTDGTSALITSLAAKDGRVKGLTFSRNFGHQSALLAGLDFARGDAVIMMDGDLQHPPMLIPEMVSRWHDGYDVVTTFRKEMEDASVVKRATARWFYAFLNMVGDVKVPPNSADFRLLSRPVVDRIVQMQERALFLRGLVQWVGFRQTSLTFDADKRYAGETKYSLRRMIAFAFDGITSFSTAPLSFALYFGLAVSFFSFLYAGYAIYVKLFTDLTLPGWTSILVAVLFLGGVQLITLGVIGLYLGKVFHEAKRRPRYIVQSTIPSDTSSARKA